MVIDPHAHVLPATFIEDVRAGKFGPDLFIEQGNKWELLMTRSRPFGRERVHRNPLPSRVYDIELRLEDMAATGVDRQILSVVPPCMYYGLDAGLSKEIAASFNESLAGLARAYPERFSCMATAALQDPQAAANELDRAATLGHFGVQIGSNVAGRNLDDPALDPFWEKVVSLDFPVLIHPIDVLGLDDRLKDYYLMNLIGNPLDTSIAVASLIFGGVVGPVSSLEVSAKPHGRFSPPGSAGAGSMATTNGKNPKERGRRRRIPTSGNSTTTRSSTIPIVSSSLGRPWGRTSSLYGTDYPFDMGYSGVAREVPGFNRLPAADREKILAGNVRRLYRL